MIHYKDFVCPDLDKLPIIDRRFRSGKYPPVYYINLPMCYDSEVTSYYNSDGIKRATLYIWQLNVFGTVYYGRTPYEFIEFLTTIKNSLGLTKQIKAIVYVHNLAYDSHFILPYANITKMFATGLHEPLTFEIDDCFIFKCSARLSGKKLATLSKAWEKEHPEIHKIDGFDYSKIRHYATPLTADELRYCEMDVIVLYEYILSEISQNNNKIYEIPLTKTGYARRFCRNICLKSKYYKKWFKTNTPVSPELYKMLTMAFCGGVTHANRCYVGETYQDVDSFDLASSYPSQMVKRKYPCTPFIKKQISEIPDTDRYATIAAVRLENMQAVTKHSILSAHKCQFKGCSKNGLVIDNGRIVRCDGYCYCVITDVDFENFKMFYTWDKLEIYSAYVSNKNYLPDEFVGAVLKSYCDKSYLKGDDDKKIDYQLLKGLLNSLYGMCVSKIIHSDYSYKYDEDSCDFWREKTIDPDEIKNALEKYRDDNTSFLLYQTGVYITAYARNDLLRTIKAICDRATSYDEDGIPIDDVVYYDTDSIKLLHSEKYIDIFQKFNDYNMTEMYSAMKSHGFKRDLVEPTSADGYIQQLGIFDHEENKSDKSYPYTYALFKTLGAKRYMYSYDGDNIEITLSGVSKKAGAAYLQELSDMQQVSPFDLFKDGLNFPRGRSGKQTVTYFDIGFEEPLTDYLGNTVNVTEKAYIHIEDAGYELSMDSDFMRLITKNKRGELL